MLPGVSGFQVCGPITLIGAGSLPAEQLYFCPNPVFIGSYTWSYVFDHDQNSGLLTFSPHCQQELRKLILELINKEQTNTPNSFSNTAQLQWLKNQNYDTYKQSFDSVQNYILSGDCYQVNLAQRFECDLSQLSRAMASTAIIWR